jgi:DNA-binding NtrC family response regulator
MNRNILIVDDDPATLLLFSHYLSDKGYHIKETSNLTGAKKAVTSQQFDAVILDMMLPDGNGMDWIKDLKENCPDIAIIVITSAGDIPVAVEAMRRGADNFLTKPVNMAEMVIFLQKSLEFQSLKRKDLAGKRLKKKAQPYFGENVTMKGVMGDALMAAENEFPILIQGETGTGKSILARWIHEHSQRSSAHFVELNCSGLRGELLSSELFGHVKGAFTSAIQEHQGLIEVADSGTLFLDEIGDMDITVQPLFLKVLDDKEYRRVGDAKLRWSNFRLICATNRSIHDAIKQGRFRTDLFFRINIFLIVIPPLRERLDDLEGLVRHILFSLGADKIDISEDVLNLLKNYSWPGNVRELKNFLDRAVFLTRGGPLRCEHFRGIENPSPVDLTGEIERGNLDRLVDEHIKSVIQSSGGDIRKAASELGISKSTIYRKLKKTQDLL